VQSRILRAFAGELPVVVAPLAGPEDRAAQATATALGEIPAGTTSLPSADWMLAVITAVPALTGSPVITASSASPHPGRQSADLDAGQAAACHLDICGHELAAGRHVLTVHASSALALPPAR